MSPDELLLESRIAAAIARARSRGLRIGKMTYGVTWRDGAWRPVDHLGGCVCPLGAALLTYQPDGRDPRYQDEPGAREHGKPELTLAEYLNVDPEWVDGFTAAIDEPDDYDAASACVANVAREGFDRGWRCGERFRCYLD